MSTVAPDGGPRRERMTLAEWAALPEDEPGEWVDGLPPTSMRLPYPYA